jgi:hypothetical protein
LIPHNNAAIGHGLGQQRHHGLAIGRLGDLLLQPGLDLADVARQERRVVDDQMQLGIAVQAEHIRGVVGRGRAQSDPVGGEHAATLNSRCGNHRPDKIRGTRTTRCATVCDDSVGI